MMTKTVKTLKKNLVTVAGLYRAGHFKTDLEAQGAFELAHQQALDGLGGSVADWMGLTKAEYAAWFESDTLPVRARKVRG